MLTLRERKKWSHIKEITHEIANFGLRVSFDLDVS